MFYLTFFYSDDGPGKINFLYSCPPCSAGGDDADGGCNGGGCCNDGGGNGGCWNDGGNCGGWNG